MKLRSLIAGLILLILTIAWFGTLGQRALVHPDEGRYAEIPREMVYTKDWITPRLNGIKYFEKPALQYWATAVSFKLFGESEWSARIWPALTGFSGILLAWYTGRRLWGNREGIYAAAILGSSLLYAIMGHVITLDMSLTFFLQLALSAFIIAQATADPTASRKWMWVAWAALALAVLSKGLVALVLTGMALVGYSIVNRDFAPWKRMNMVSGIALFLLIAAPWFVLVSLRNPEFPHFFFIHEHFDRFLTKEHHRYQPAYYFLFIYALGAIPWVFLLIHAAIRSWLNGVRGTFSPERFLVVFAGAAFVFFSVSSSKLAPYILPIFPALALLGGRLLAQLSPRIIALHVAVYIPLAIAAIHLSPSLAAAYDNDYSMAMMLRLSIWAEKASWIWLIALLLATGLAAAKKALPAIVVLAAGCFIATTALLFAHDALSPFTSGKSLTLTVPPPLNPDMPFYSVGGYEQTVPFYIQRPVTLVQYQDEMEFGLTQEPDKWVPTIAEFKQRWLKESNAYAVMSLSTYAGLKAEGLPMEERARNQRVIIVRRSAP